MNWAEPLKFLNSGGIALLDWGGCTSLWNLLMVVVNTPEDPLPNLLWQKWGVFLAHYPSCFVTLCRMEMCWIHILQAFKFASACQYHIPSYRSFSFCTFHLIASKKVAEGKKKFKVLDRLLIIWSPEKANPPFSLNLECVWQWFSEVFLIFQTLENIYFSSIKNVRNTSHNHCQTHY